MAPETECPDCGAQYSAVTQHLRQSSCQYPQLNEKQEEILTGVMMGDGNVKNDGWRPFIRVGMINREYLNELSQMFPFYSLGVEEKFSAEESFRNNNLKTKQTSPESYNDVFQFRTRRSPVFEKFKKWYSTGEKKFPDSINLTPDVLKHWYVSDGNTSGHSDKQIQIGISSQVDEREKIQSWFEETPIGGCSVYTREKDHGYTSARIQLTVEQSEIAYEYMGDPLPGFQYKWP